MDPARSFVQRNGSATSTPYLVDGPPTRYVNNNYSHTMRPTPAPMNRRPLAFNPHPFKSESKVGSSSLRYELDFADTKKNSDKSKGLRHFSTKVCEKVKEKGSTNYNEVADELVSEYFDTHIQMNDEKHQYDMKNIRRRVYDALNVLLAMNIIQKNKKDITWVGLPTTTAQEMKRLEEEKKRRLERIREKTENLQEMIIQLVSYKTLVEQNREKEREEGRPADSSVLYLPYVIVNTEKRATVECSVSSDKSEFLFNFDQPFEIHDDVEVLKRLGHAHGLERGEVREEMLDKIKSCLPPALRECVDDIMHSAVVDRVKPAPIKYEIQKQQPQQIPEARAIQQMEDSKPPVEGTRIVQTKLIARPIPGSRYTVVKPQQAHLSQQQQQQQHHAPAPKRAPQVVYRSSTGPRYVAAPSHPNRPMAAPVRHIQQPAYRAQPTYQVENQEYDLYEETIGEEENMGYNS